MEAAMTMTSKEAERMLEGFLSGMLAPLGFKRIQDQRYGRPENDAFAQVSFPWRLSVQGFGVFTTWVALRFEPLAHWLADGDASDAEPTTVMPIHLLHDNREIVEWEFASAADLEKSRDAVLGELRTYAQPFIERYSRLADLRKALESPDKKDWFVAGLNVDTRVTTLAAIQLVEGGKASAMKTLDDGIRELDESLAGKSPELRKRERQKRGFAMRSLRRRLLANG
jgi:hypothetical protein